MVFSVFLAWQAGQLAFCGSVWRVANILVTFWPVKIRKLFVITPTQQQSYSNKQPKGSLQNSKPGKLGKNSQPPLTPPPCGGWELCELGNNVRNLSELGNFPVFRLFWPPLYELGNFVKILDPPHFRKISQVKLGNFVNFF